MTIEKLYEQAKENGWEDLQVMVLHPGEVDAYGNKSFPTVSPGRLVHRNKDFWPTINEEFLVIL